MVSKGVTSAPHPPIFVSLPSSSGCANVLLAAPVVAAAGAVAVPAVAAAVAVAAPAAVAVAVTAAVAVAVTAAVAVAVALIKVDQIVCLSF